MQCRLPHKSIKYLDNVTMTITNNLTSNIAAPSATIKISDTTYNTATTVVIPARTEVIATVSPSQWSPTSQVSITLNGTTVATNAITSGTKVNYRGSATYTFNATANFTVTFNNSRIPSLAIVMPA